MDLQTLAAQLRRPFGADAQEMGERLNSSNQGINRQAIACLKLKAGERVLELGPGNGAFVPELLAQAPELHYTGLDWSAEMVAEGLRLNAEAVAAGQARFLEGDSAQLPFADASFHHVLAVNTLYFWEQPEQHLAEIRRVLVPNGQLCLAFGDKRFMQGLPFTAHGFTLYSADSAAELLARCGFQQADYLLYQETERSNTGEVLEKHVHIACYQPKQTNP